MQTKLARRRKHLLQRYKRTGFTTHLLRTEKMAKEQSPSFGIDATPQLASFLVK